LLFFRVLEYQKGIALILLLSLSVFCTTLSYNTETLLKDAFGTTTTVDKHVATDEILHAPGNKIIEQQEQEEAFTPTKKITMILEDTEI
jgi:hypothetical protein